MKQPLIAMTILKKQPPLGGFWAWDLHESEGVCALELGNK